jgi:hypothetical protein
MWTCLLLSVFGGNSLRSLGWFELRRRRLAATSEHLRCETAPGQGITTGVLSALVAPVMLIWGAVGLLSILNWVDEHTLRLSIPSSRIMLLNINFNSVLDLWLDMCTTVIWLGSGVLLMCIGIRSVFLRKPAHE